MTTFCWRDRRVIFSFGWIKENGCGNNAVSSHLFVGPTDQITTIQVTNSYILPFWPSSLRHRSTHVASHWPSPPPWPAPSRGSRLIMPVLLVYSSTKPALSVCHSPRRLCPSSVDHVSTKSSHYYSSAGPGDLPSANAPRPFPS